MQRTFTVPYFEKDVLWHDEDYTVVIGANGVGKTLLLNEMMKYCDKAGISYNHYNAIEALQDAPFLIDESEDDDIILACRMMQKISHDFDEDVKRWAVVYGVDPEDPAMLRHTLKMAGNGYTRMFIMTVLAARNPAAGYYFLDLPETSLHIMLMRRIAEYLMGNFRHMKFVFATHSPEIFASFEMDHNGEEEQKHVICLPENFMEPA
jgi:predicted ATPase